ncbi:hypothetical protein K438DRAFT_1747592 [Mycena galopus ATCC 62051]|nr:hypothetical protein K438DRAFT_1747592 [Mycena galopus ATCC 62051]
MSVVKNRVISSSAPAPVAGERKPTTARAPQPLPVLAPNRVLVVVPEDAARELPVKRVSVACRVSQSQYTTHEDTAITTRHATQDAPRTRVPRSLPQRLMEVTSPGGHSGVPPPHTTIGTLAALVVKYEGNPYELELCSWVAKTMAHNTALLADSVTAGDADTVPYLSANPPHSTKGVYTRRWRASSRRRPAAPAPPRRSRNLVLLHDHKARQRPLNTNETDAHMMIPMSPLLSSELPQPQINSSRRAIVDDAHPVGDFAIKVPRIQGMDPFCADGFSAGTEERTP